MKPLEAQPHTLSAGYLGRKVRLVQPDVLDITGTLTQVRHYLRGKNQWTEMTVMMNGISHRYRVKKMRKPTVQLEVYTEYTTSAK